MAILNRSEPLVVVHRDDDSMGWLGWLLVGVGVVATFMLTRKELPAFRRYMKMRSM